MSQSGYTPIQLYRTSTASAAPTALNLADGELAINYNTADGKLFYKDSGGVVQVLATKGTAAIGGSNTQVQYNSSGSLAGSANFTFDGTTVTAAGFSGPHNGTVGATTPNTGAFTTLTTSSTVTLSAGTANGVAYLNGSKVLTTGSGLTYNGTNTQTLQAAAAASATFNVYGNGASTGLILQGGSDSNGYISATNSFYLATNGSSRLSVGTAGNVTINAPSSGTSLAVTSAVGASAITATDGANYTIALTRNTTYGGGIRSSAGLALAVNDSATAALGINTSGNVTINAPTSGAALTVNGVAGNAALNVNSGSQVGVQINASSTTTGIYASFAQAGAIGGYVGIGSSVITGASSTDLCLTSNGGNIYFGRGAGGAIAAQISNAGNVTINAPTSGKALTVTGVAADAQIQFGNGSGQGYLYGNGGAVDFISGSTGWPIRFGYGTGTMSTECVRIDGSGNLLVGTASASFNSSNSTFFYQPTGYWVVNHANGTSTGTRYVGFGYNVGEIGSITQSGTTAVLYNTTSDQRLKENIADAAPASDLIDSIKVRQFDWISDGTHQRYGMVAQELYAVAPEAVHAPSDPDAMMAVDYSKLVPMLIKEVQSLRARISQLESK